MATQAGPNQKSGLTRTTKLETPRFLVAIEFHSREAAVDQCIALLNTGWPRGPKEEDLKLIVIGREGEGGYVEGVEIDANRLSQVDKAIDEFGETK